MTNILKKEEGYIRVIPLSVVIASVGIISFLLVSSTVPFQGGFGNLFPKSLSRAASCPTSACYYVDGANGNDANSGTSETSAFKTIQKGISQATIPGTTVLVRNGVYNEEVAVINGGTASAPVTLQNYPGETPIIDGSMEVTNWTPVSGTVWKANFTHRPIVGPTTVGDDAFSESSCPSNNSASFSAGDKDAAAFVDDVADQAHVLRPFCLTTNQDNTISSISALPAGGFVTNVIPDAGPYANTTNTIWVNLSDGSNPNNNHHIKIPAYNHAILLATANANYFTLRGMTTRYADNMIYTWQATSHDIIVDQNNAYLHHGRIIDFQFCTSNITITNNKLHDSIYENIHLESDNSLVQNNQIYNTVAPWSWYGANGILVNGSNDKIIGNSVSGMKSGPAESGGTGIFNEQWYNGNNQIQCQQNNLNYQSAQNNLVEKNVIYNNDSVAWYNSGGDNNVFQNNLVYNNKSGGIELAATGGTAGSPPQVSERDANNNKAFNNTIYNNSGFAVGINNPSSTGNIIGGNIIYANNNGGAQYFIDSTGATKQQNFDTGTNPQFINQSSFDLRLQSTSPAIRFAPNLFSSGVTQDYNCTARPQSGNFDAGALQFGSTPSCPWSSPSPSPTSSPSQIPTPSPAGSPGNLVISVPLSLSKTIVCPGQTITGTVTYKNIGGSPLSYNDIVVASRPPGGTNSGGPYDDFSPIQAAGSLNPGQTITVNASRTFSSTDPTGNWYAFATYHDSNGVSHDDTNNITFTVNASCSPSPTPVPTPTKTPTPLPTSTPATCPRLPLGDANCDGAIDIFDYSLVITHFNQSGTNIAGDVNKDGVVDIFDYSLVVTHFGQ